MYGLFYHAMQVLLLGNLESSRSIKPSRSMILWRAFPTSWFWRSHRISGGGRRDIRRHLQETVLDGAILALHKQNVSYRWKITQEDYSLCFTSNPFELFYYHYLNDSNSVSELSFRTFIQISVFTCLECGHVCTYTHICLYVEATLCKYKSYYKWLDCSRV